MPSLKPCQDHYKFHPVFSSRNLRARCARRLKTESDKQFITYLFSTLFNMKTHSHHTPHPSQVFPVHDLYLMKHAHLKNVNIMSYSHCRVMHHFKCGFISFLKVKTHIYTFNWCKLSHFRFISHVERHKLSLSLIHTYSMCHKY